MSGMFAAWRHDFTRLQGPTVSYYARGQWITSRIQSFLYSGSSKFGVGSQDWASPVWVEDAFYRASCLPALSNTFDCPKILTKKRRGVLQAMRRSLLACAVFLGSLPLRAALRSDQFTELSVDPRSGLHLLKDAGVACFCEQAWGQQQMHILTRTKW